MVIPPAAASSDDIPTNNTKKKASSKKSSFHSHERQRQRQRQHSSRNLPLLEGLVQKPGMADAIVKEALHTYAAAMRIARWIEQQRMAVRVRRIPSSATTAAAAAGASSSSTRKRRRTRTRDTKTSAVAVAVAAVNTTSPPPQPPQYVHWLFRSLQSPCGPERKVACLILANGCPLDDVHSLWQLLEILHSLLRTTGDATRKNSGTTTTPSSFVTLVVAWIKHILLMVVPPSMETDTATDTDTAVAVPLVPVLAGSTTQDTKATTTNSTTPLVLAFLRHKRMGLSWICSTLWKHAGDDGDYKNGDYSSQQQQAAAVTTTAALADLLHHLILVGTTHESMAKAHSLLWKQPEQYSSTSLLSSSLSPLACLIATRHVWKQRKHALTKSQKDVLHILKHLTDPHTVPTSLRNTTSTATTATTTNNNKEVNTKRRLIDTFPPPSVLSSPPEEGTAFSSGVTRTTRSASIAAAAAAATSSSRNPPTNSTATTTTTNAQPSSSASPSIRRSSTATTDRMTRIFTAVYGPNHGASADAAMDDDDDDAVDNVARAAISADAAASNNSARREAFSSATQQALELFGTASAAADAVATNGATTTTSGTTTISTTNRPNTTSAGGTSARPRMFARRPEGILQPPPRLFHQDDEEDDDDDDDDDEVMMHYDYGNEEDEDGEGHFDHEEHSFHDEDSEEHSENDEDDDDDDHHHHHDGHEDDDNEDGMDLIEEGEHREEHHEEDATIDQIRIGNASGRIGNAEGRRPNLRQRKNGEDEDDEEDEDIDSNSEDDEDCEFDHDEDEDGEHDIVIHGGHADDEDDDELLGYRQDLLDLQHLRAERRSNLGLVQGTTRTGAALLNPTSVVTGSAAFGNQAEELAQRKKVYLRACMQVLAAQHPALLSRFAKQQKQEQQQRTPAAFFPIQAEHDLMTSLLNIVEPPKKPVNSKIILRRAPTQEDFFRGSLSKNPISLNMLRKEGNTEPTVRDLRQQIADDLQMSDSAELLELLVANKIIDVDLKLRVVHQVVWKRHLIQNASAGPTSYSGTSLSALLSGGRGVARSLITSRSGLSMIYTSSGILGAAGIGPGGSSDANGNTINEDTPLSALPPMIVTYRLTGVDGEATEDTVTTLEDPEAPSETADPEQVERIMEKEFGITRSLTEGRGVNCLLKSLERNISDTLRKIRRDDIGSGENLSRSHFKTSLPYAGLSLLSCCAKLPSNRKLLLQSRAPTILLRLLLDVLHGLEDEGLSESNPTAKVLQELIEILASDMVSSNGDTANASAFDDAREDAEQDASTLRLLLSAIETSSLSRPLRNVIAKLLPYLTYGQPALSKELAMEFVRHVDLQRLGEYQLESEDNSQVLMSTFVHASTSLPANDVCNSLRSELILCGYLERVAAFVMLNCPFEPPSWSPSLWTKAHNLTSKKKVQLEKQWRNYTQRPGLKQALDMLIGLSKGHKATQSFIGNFTLKKDLSLTEACHWIEATSDNTSARVAMKGLGLIAETLLDELASDGSPVATQVMDIRRKTRNRKKEIAMERRSKALVSMGVFGAKGAAVSSGSENPPAQNSLAGVRGAAASLFAPVLGFFQNSESSIAQVTSTKRQKKDAASKKKDYDPIAKPTWMAEMEEMEDETGLTCAVCQEGRSLQPSELLGLYAHVKKVSVPLNQCGGRNDIDGTSLLTSLPTIMPDSLSDSHASNEWYPAARAAAEELLDTARTPMPTVAASRRATYFTTTVSAGNAIHFSCHNLARQADRNHPKAPKTEWEGASLRNSRVNCNMILPLVSSRSSKVALVAVDAALTEYQTGVSNLLGARPKSMLWNVLHDVRFLVLRMAYGEPLNADCGGGSLVSNSQLVYHQLLMADMFEKDSQVDSPETAQHARNLSAGFLATSAIIHADDYNNRNQLHRGLSDSATMACLTCILFHNTTDDYGAVATLISEDEKPHPKRRWLVGRDYFLRGLLNCAGRRHALGVDGSGCTTSRNSAGTKRRRPGGFADWDIVDEDEMLEFASVGGGIDLANTAGTTSTALLRSTNTNSSTASIEDFRDALRPMIVYFAMMDQLSNDFVLSLDDLKVEELANRLVEVINDCRSCKNIQELLRKARVSLEDDEIMDELQKGMIAA